MKGLAIVLMVLMLVAPLSGCFGDISKSLSGTNVVLLDSSAKSGFNFNYGFYTAINLTVKNEGKNTAHDVRIHMYVENQDKRKEFDNTFHIANELAPNEVASRSIIVDSWQNDTILKATIKVMWDGGSNSYWAEWAVSG